MPPLWQVLVPLGLALTLAGCASVPPGATQGDVLMPKVHFEPANLTVAVGKRVVWANDGDLRHTITSDAGLFDGSVLPGESFAWTFDAPGTYAYHCVPHAGRGAGGAWEGMVGRILVTA